VGKLKNEACSSIKLAVSVDIVLITMKFGRKQQTIQNLPLLGGEMCAQELQKFKIWDE